MDRKYNLKLDLQFRCNNSVMKFRQSDNNTSDFFMRITNGGKLANIDNAIVILAVIKPNGNVQSQFLEVKDNKVYADLQKGLKDQLGTYKAQALLIYQDERVSTDVIEYEVQEDNILNQLDTVVEESEDIVLLKEMFSRLSKIELQEEQRGLNEVDRVEAEKLRKEAIEKLKSDINNLISNTNKKVNDTLQVNTDNINTFISTKENYINNKLDTKISEVEEDINNIKVDINNKLNAQISEVNTKVDNKIVEIDNLTNTKISEVDRLKNEFNSNEDSRKISEATRQTNEVNRNTEFDKIKVKANEINLEEQNRIASESNRIASESVRQTNEGNRIANENKRVEAEKIRQETYQAIESKVDNVAVTHADINKKLVKIEDKNKTQDIYLKGLFNENKDKRLSVEGEGNSLKLESSVEGLVTVDKVEGDTLVNLFKKFNSNKVDTVIENNIKTITMPNYSYSTASEDDLIQAFKPSTKYTMIVNILKNTMNNGYFILCNTESNNFSNSVHRIEPLKTGIMKLLIETKSTLPSEVRLRGYMVGANEGEQISFSEHIILEGDYTNKPIPSHFTGLQSSFEEGLVTQEMVDNGLEKEENLGKYKVDVEVRGKNLFDINEIIENIDSSSYELISNGLILKSERCCGTSLFKNTFKENTRYLFSYDYENSPNTNYFIQIHYTDGTVEGFYTQNKGRVIRLSKENKTINYIRFSCGSYGVTKLSNIQIEESFSPTPYEPCFSQTKTIYLSSPLHKGDEIVVKDGKLCHWHKMGKVVLDGSEEGYSVAGHEKLENTLGVETYFLNNVIKPGVGIYCDKFKYKNVHSSDEEAIWSHSVGGNLRIRVSKSKLSTQDIQGFKQWLSNNPTTVIYELAEPYYEVIEEDSLLLQIPNNATLEVDSIIPVTKLNATYTTNITSVYSLEETNKVQDDLIDVSLMATDEMFMMLEPLLEAVQINERGMSKMVEMYVAMCMRGLKTVDEVPLRYREDVRRVLEELEK